MATALRHVLIALLLVWSSDSVKAIASENAQQTYEECLQKCMVVANSSRDVSCVNFGLERVPNEPKCRFARVLDLQNNNITELRSGDFAVFSELSYLSLSKNKIFSISPEAFQGLGSLLGLQLRSNNITELNKGVFAGLTGLGQRLSLSENRISKVTTGVFEHLSTVKLLSLDDNRIESIQAGSFNGMAELTRLLLRRNIIQTIRNGTFEGLAALQILDLRENNVAVIADDAFRGLTSLVELRLESNLMISVEPITDLPRLAFLGLAENNIPILVNHFLRNKFKERDFGITVQGNGLHCACLNEPLRLWYTTRQADDRPICGTPQAYAGEALADLKTPFECLFTTVITSTDEIPMADGQLMNEIPTKGQPDSLLLGLSLMGIIALLILCAILVVRRYVYKKRHPKDTRTLEAGTFVDGYSTILAEQSHEDKTTRDTADNQTTLPLAPNPIGHSFQSFAPDEKAQFLPSHPITYAHVSSRDALLPPSSKENTRLPDLLLNPDPVCQIDKRADGKIVITPGPVFEEDDIFFQNSGPSSSVHADGFSRPEGLGSYAPINCFPHPSHPPGCPT